MNDKTAWVHPNPVQRGFVVLPDGHQISVREAKARGLEIAAWPESAKAARLHPHDPDLVVTERGQALNCNTAREAGFSIVTGLAEAPRSAESAWRSAIVRSPEAQGRAAAVAQLVSTQSPDAMTVDQARSMLRGLPLECDEQVQTPMTSNTNDPRAARLAEITAAARQYNVQRAYTSKSAPMPAARAPVNIEPVKLRRLTEIRLTALQARGANADEQKALSYALQVHDQTGAPLADTFARLNVDISKIIK
ncbi:hypothetical protein [Bradyrhizobium sp. STM 3809]|uniref:hypothetical protein n=1 Tax=Bradyrhizobium sp. STM 3809 TaxID=551936 RepID=UPI0002409804|nr:hypothetical protein [Bradyrhizobium sp. STM 3809]CCE01419.1 hypothetical protein BRAS3809_4960002 [Bradyrhizobium sp. STM 3809]